MTATHIQYFSKICDMSKLLDDPQTNLAETEDTDDVRVGMSMEGGTGLTQTGEPVHEMLTLAALINSKYHLDPTITYQKLRDSPTQHSDINDFVRGVMWNDDPECELFNRDAENNFSYSYGVDWASKYQFGGYTKPELIHRSHFGNLQWLHAMAQGMDKPQDTKARIYQWIELMYNIATGQTPASTPITQTTVSKTFEDPANYTTVGELLTHRHPGPAVIAHRALGSCFHVIQDSYAHGHTRRERINPNLQPGEADRWGAVLNFHTYNGQNDSQHKHFDHGSESLGAIDLTKADSWNGLEGCRDGLDRCIVLADFWHRRAPWTEVREWLDADVFVISKDATVSDNSI